MDLMIRFNPGEYCGGMEGILPDLTSATSSAWVVAEAKGDLPGQLCSAVAPRHLLTHTKVHISNARQPKLQMSDFVSYLFSAKISGGIYSGV